MKGVLSVIVTKKQLCFVSIMRTTYTVSETVLSASLLCENCVSHTFRLSGSLTLVAIVTVAIIISVD
jgi:hypothetical protein